MDLGSYLYALLADGKLIKVEDGGLDDVNRGEHLHPDVQGVAPFGVQDQDL